MLEEVMRIPCLKAAFEEHKEVLRDFHGAARRLLSGTVPMRPVSDELFTPERNFFSSLFLATLAALGLDARSRSLFGLVNQCLRATVTACDNLLDEDRREVFPFDLPGEGYRFKSVLTLMAADRLLAERIMEEVAAGRISAGQAQGLQRLSLTALVASGIEEHGEEEGVSASLSPDEILRSVHRIKTGLLFEAPVRIPESLGLVGGAASLFARRGLSDFGIGCQIIDDMADVALDLRQRRHNYVLALVAEASAGELATLRKLQPESQEFVHLMEPFLGMAAEDAIRLLKKGLSRLSLSGLPISAAEQIVIAQDMFPLLLTKDLPKAIIPG